MTEIFLDGRYIGETKEPEKYVNEIRGKRRTGLLSNQVNVAHHINLDEIKVLTDSGRVRRPLLIIENGKVKFTKEHLEKIKKGSYV